ncbi:MAG: polysaccharide export protein [Myxococcota bacterium]|nr:polysaccharide export protein [Myxococcota bacterium]
MRSFSRSLARIAVCIGLAAAAASCAGPGNYVWFTSLPPEAVAPTTDFVIDSGDVINVRILGHEDMSTHTRVRADGRLALPIIGEVEARGKRPSALRTEIEARLKDYVVMPSVTVNIEEARPITVSMLGEVLRPGVYPVEANAHLAQAMALAGGVTEFATRDRVFVVRSLPQPTRIRFTYQAILRDQDRAGSFPLRAGDVIVVE